MGKIIAITGSNGSGKTTFATNLALLLARQKKITILVNGDINVGSTQCVLGAEIPKEKSLKKYLADKIQVPEKYLVQLERESNLYLLGVESGNNTYQKPLFEKDQIGTLITTLSMSCDYLILDLPFDLQNGMTLLGISYADTVCVTYKATTECALWHKAYKGTIRSISKKAPIPIVTMHNASLTPPTFVEQIGENFFLLPNCEDAWVRSDAGRGIVESKGKNESRYTKTLEDFIDSIERG